MPAYTNVINNPRGRGLTGWTGDGTYNSTVDAVELEWDERAVASTTAAGTVTALVYVETADGTPARVAVGPSTSAPGVSDPHTIASGSTLVRTFPLPSAANVAIDAHPKVPLELDDPDSEEPIDPPSPSTTYVRLALVTGNDSPGFYFDGASLARLRAVFEWVGSPHAGQSRAYVLPAKAPCGLFFASEEHQEWVAAPDEGVTINPEGWGVQGKYLSGGAYNRRSANRHNSYTMSWTEIQGDDLFAITNFNDGLYGQGPFYFALPGTYDNILPPAWAVPRLACQDAPPLVENVRPRPLTATNEGQGRPTTSAMYTIVGTDARRQMLPIYVPSEMVLYLGVRGSFGGTTRMQYTVNGTPLTLPALGGNDLTNRFVVGPAKVEISLQGEGTATINSMTAALRSTFTPPTGRFVSGQGHSGVDFPENGVTKTLVSAARNAWGAAVTLVETGQWR